MCGTPSKALLKSSLEAMLEPCQDSVRVKMASDLGTDDVF